MFVPVLSVMGSDMSEQHPIFQKVSGHDVYFIQEFDTVSDEMLQAPRVPALCVHACMHRNRRNSLTAAKVPVRGPE